MTEWMLRRGTALLPGALALLLVAAQPAAAQEEPAAEPRGEFGEEIEVGEVLLDVLVTDRDGNVVVGLQPEDFVVREDGEEVAVDRAVFYSSAELAENAESLAAKGLEIDPVPEDRYFILFFDDLGKFAGGGNVGLVQQQIRAGRDARQWVGEALAPADWVAVVSYDRSLELHQDFTRDRAAIVTGIERATAGGRGRYEWPSRRQATTGPALADDLPQGRALSRQSPRVYDALELVADAASDIRGRKNLVYFGLGFGDVDSFGQYQEDQRYYPDMVRALNDANVAVYTIDLAPTGSTHPFQHALSQLAEETGGRNYPFFTSFMTPLDEIAGENTGYYLLSYRAEHRPGERGFQRVEVEARDPAFVVRARRGYLYGSVEEGGAG